MLADHHRLDVARPDPQPIGQVHSEAQAVDQGAGREHPVMAGQLAGEVGQRVRRIGDHHQHRPRGDRHDLGHDVGVHRGVGVQQPPPSLGVGPVGGAAGRLVHPGGDDHQRRTGQRVVVAGAHVHRRGQRRGVAQIGGDPVRPIRRAVDEDELPAHPATLDQR